MSIHNMLHKIKGTWERRGDSILHLLVLILVGASSFGLGRISADIPANTVNSGIKIVENKDSHAVSLDNHNQNRLATSLANAPTSLSLDTQKKYVASKNGKLYYTSSCSGAKRIKPENQIWFTTSTEAEGLGYTPSLSCR